MSVPRIHGILSILRPELFNDCPTPDRTHKEINRACSIRAWILDFVQEETLPLHSHGYTRKTVLEDEEVLQEVQRELSKRAKVGFVKAEDICDIVASEKLQTLFIQLGI